MIHYFSRLWQCTVVSSINKGKKCTIRISKLFITTPQVLRLSLIELFDQIAILLFERLASLSSYLNEENLHFS